MALIDLKTLLHDLNFYSQQFITPPRITVTSEGEVWLDDAVTIRINMIEAPITRPAIVPRTSMEMHHEIILHGSEKKIEQVTSKVAEKSIEYWTHYKYWELVNE